MIINFFLRYLKKILKDLKKSNFHRTFTHIVKLKFVNHTTI